MKAPGHCTTSLTTYRRRVRFYQSAILILALGYLLQVVTPLRLHPDTVVLLSVADSVAHGGRFQLNGQPTVFPPGYPAFVALLLKLRLAHNWVLIGFNVISLFVGLWAVCYVLMRRIFDTIFPVLNVCLVSSLSFVFIKYSTIPLTDAGFFGIAMCCLAVMESVSQVRFGRQFWQRIIACWALAVAALALRRVGLALIPALLWSMFSHEELRMCIRRLSNRTKIAIVLGVGCASAFTAWIVAETSTLRDRQAVLMGHSLTDVVSQVFSFRLRELGEMTFNSPFFTLPPSIQPAVPLVGALLLSLVVGGMVLKLEIRPTTVYLCSYSLIIFSWPCYDPRFWLPVIPLLVAYSWLSIRRIMRDTFCWEMFRVVYLTLFGVMGIMTLRSSTAVTLSGSEFPNIYREQYYHSTYCAVFPSCNEGPPKVDEAALRVFRTFR
jgi:hypothetical protein